MDSGQALIIGLGTLFLIFFTVQDFLANKITIGSLVFIFSTFGALTGPLFRFTWGMREFYQSMADFESLFKYGKIENEIKDPASGKKAKIQKGEIEIKNISFSYGKRKIFENLSLSIPKNKKIALVGPSGCGKTTLVKLIYRLYDVQVGKITIDGKDVKNFEQESYRSEMSIVPQDCALFDDTVYNNIAFSNPTASRKDVFAAIKFAQLDKIIEKFPQKENTVVGERGVKLSGGERQRVSIARAVLANKKVLVLDEATSSLDSETEHEIQKDLEILMKDRTSIIIAHRLSTIMKADTIVVMDKGKIVQMGNHEHLIKQEGLYKKLWQLQKGGYIKD
jgi:ABC-type multidrug transport system fused ATPase/permease subunit